QNPNDENKTRPVQLDRATCLLFNALWRWPTSLPLPAPQVDLIVAKRATDVGGAQWHGCESSADVHSQVSGSRRQVAPRRDHQLPSRWPTAYVDGAARGEWLLQDNHPASDRVGSIWRRS